MLNILSIIFCHFFLLIRMQAGNEFSSGISILTSRDFVATWRVQIVIKEVSKKSFLLFDITVFLILKMVKISELSTIIRTEIVTKYNLGISVINIAKEYNLSRQTIYYQINKHKNLNQITNVRRTGRNRKTNADADRLIVRQFKKNPLITPKAVALEWNTTSPNPISERTIRRRLIEADIKSYIAKPIPFITPKNKLKRLEFAQRYILKPVSFWRNVLWTDESTFEFHSSKKKVLVRLNKNYRKKNAPVCQKVSHGGGNVMFWGSVSYNGVGDLVPIDGSMNQSQYLRTLNDFAFPSGDRLIGEEFILQQDNAPCHKAKMINTFLREVGVKTLDWPPQSPDLNIIENVWSLIKRKRAADITRTRDETITEVTKEWKRIPLKTLQTLVDSVPNRLQKVLDTKGGYIFY